MHAKHSITYKVNEQDYFGAYAKLQRQFMIDQKAGERAHQVLLEDGQVV